MLTGLRDLLRYTRATAIVGDILKIRARDIGLGDMAEQLLHQGDSSSQMMQVSGEEGIPIEDFATCQKSQFLDLVYLQQDAFDQVDASTPLERQKESFELVRTLIQRVYLFKDKDEARRFFTQLTSLLKNLNYAAQGSPEYAKYRAQIDELKTLGRPAAPDPAPPVPTSANVRRPSYS